MRIHNHWAQNQFQHLNQAAAPGLLEQNQKNRQLQPVSGPGGRKTDLASFSRQGKDQSALESLMKQKQQVTDQKNQLIAKTLEEGGSLDSIQLQLSTYQEQLDGLDEQISQLLSQQLQPEEEQENPLDTQPREELTPQEAQSRQIESMTRLAAGLDQAQTLSSVQHSLEGQANVLESELSLDRATGVLRSKEELLSRLEERSRQLQGKLGERLDQITQTLEESDSPAPARQQEEEPPLQ